jgi:hypothetical protein
MFRIVFVDVFRIDDRFDDEFEEIVAGVQIMSVEAVKAHNKIKAMMSHDSTISRELSICSWDGLQPFPFIGKFVYNRDLSRTVKRMCMHSAGFLIIF